MDDGWVTIKPNADSGANNNNATEPLKPAAVEPTKPASDAASANNNYTTEPTNEIEEDIIEKLAVSNISPPSEDEESVGSGDSQNETTANDDVTHIGAVGNDDVQPQNGNSVKPDEDTTSDKEENKKKKISPLKFFKKGSKDIPEGEKLPNKNKARRTSQIPMELKVETLPQVFITKYLGKDVCTGLWGIQHTHGPVNKLVNAVSKLKKDEDLPLVQLSITNKGIDIAMHPLNQANTLEEGLLPVEFISYGVQDIKFTRVFSFILVKEMSWRAKKMECHAYVCDSTATCRRLSLSVALAFKEYAATLGGKPYKFHVDLRAPTEIQKELEHPEADA